MEQPLEQPEQPMEQPLEQPEQPTEQPEQPTKPTPKVRKVRVHSGAAPTNPTPPDPNYWHSRLEEHMAGRRATKNERYANLRFM
jgi:hypothetical protein